MSDTGCWICGNPRVVYTEAIGLPWCGPCWNEPEDMAQILEDLKGVRYELWQERGQRLIGAVFCGLPHGVELHDGWYAYGKCAGCGAVV